MIESCVSLSTNHLYGTGIRDLNLGGSVLCSNTSFTDCTTSTTQLVNYHFTTRRDLKEANTRHLFTLCTFKKCTGTGGAMFIVFWDAELSNTGLFNCLFQTCRTTSPLAGGGEPFLDGCSSIRLDSLRFRECSSVHGNGHDLCFNSSSAVVSLSTVSNCDSTSTPKENRIFPIDIAVGDPLPDPADIATIQSLVTHQTTSTTAEIVVTLDKEVTGSLLVLVSNSEGTGRTDPTKAPNIGRVLLFSIKSSSMGKCTASIGETGLLQLPLDDYQVVTSSFSGVYIEFRTFISAECVLDKSRTPAILNLGGFVLEGETFVLTLQNDMTLNATFSENKSTIDLGMIGESSGWIEKEVFLIMSGKKKGNDSILVYIPSSLFFKIPLAACLTDIEVSELNEAKTELKLSFSSRLLKANQDYEITIKPKDGSDEIVMNVTTDDSGLIADQTVKLYPSNENVEGWKNSIGFGKEYEVVGISAKIGEKKFPTHFSPILLKMPNEPVQVEKAECSTDQPTTTIVSVEGSRLIEDETYTLTLSGTPTDPHLLDVHTTAISVVASSSTKAKSAPLPLSSTSSSSLLFDHKYTITAITNGSETGIIVGTPSFTTRSTPTLKSVLCTLKVGDAKTAEVSISGSNVPDGEYRLILKNIVSSKETVLKLNCMNSEGKVEVEIFSSSTLEYGANYEVLSLSSSSVTVVLPTELTNRLLTMPGVPARVRSVSCVLTEDLKTHVEVVICGENLPVGETLTGKVKEVDPSSGSTTGSEIALPSTTIASTTNTEPIEIG
ncbi:hypothetical protein BLNAU_18242 [Blattamonas nauphoetae]|uniref:Uncharacterized protein n=1 Tax=Blattamonas nauphoetae TaxID=2049346 RepID=A0ABQ9X5J9_9EUKA|nr:hypothetical protein BLNAU_18242 [Blattamonas nauphoetae]